MSSEIEKEFTVLWALYPARLSDRQHRQKMWGVGRDLDNFSSSQQLTAPV